MEPQTKCSEPLASRVCWEVSADAECGYRAWILVCSSASVWEMHSIIRGIKNVKSSNVQIHKLWNTDAPGKSCVWFTHELVINICCVLLFHHNVLPLEEHQYREGHVWLMVGIFSLCHLNVVTDLYQSRVKGFRDKVLLKIIIQYILFTQLEIISFLINEPWSSYCIIK